MSAKALPTIIYQDSEWYFNERLMEIRDINEPTRYIRFDEFEIEYIKKNLAAVSDGVKLDFTNVL